MKSCVKPVAAALFAAFTLPALADTASWTFNLPATGLESQTPPYPSLATLTLTDVSGGVQFTLDPDQANPGYSLDPNNTSAVTRIDFVYSGDAIAAGDFQYDSGAAVKTFSYETNPNNMDAGYTADDAHIIVNFYTDPQSDFAVTDTSTWTIMGTTVSDFTNTFATAANKPSPTYGIISVAPFSNPEMTPNPSNWVVGVAEIPEPETYAMMLAGLGMLGVIGRRRTRAQPDADIGMTARCV